MVTWYARTIFFVEDTSRSLAFYVNKLGFKEDWTHVHDGEIIVAQVSRGDFELILNQDATRAGAGRIYFHLNEEQVEALRKEVDSKGLTTTERYWGMPITVVLDPDENELFFDSLFSAPEPGLVVGYRLSG